jgi:hypothetical protein
MFYGGLMFLDSALILSYPHLFVLELMLQLLNLIIMFKRNPF